MNRKSRKTTALLSAMAVSAAMLLNIPGSMMVNADEGHTHDYGSNGICLNDGCDEQYQPAGDADSNGYLDITNVGNLIWFANAINNGSETTDAELKNDITIPEGTEWTPIGDSSYTGTFDGANHTISGLKNSGLFGMNDGTIENLGVVEAAITGDNAASAGIICEINNGTINNCYSQVTSENKAPGICYNNMEDVNNCYTTAKNVVGRGWFGSSYCLVNDSSGNTGGYPKTEAQFKSGEVAWLLQNGQESQDSQVWGQNIGSDNYPVLGGERVYKHILINGSTIYSNSATAPADAEIWGYSISLFNVNEIQLSVKLTVENADSFKVFVGEKEVTPEHVDGTDNYTVSYPVAAKDIDERRTFTVRAADGTLLDSKVLSVSGYLKDLAANDTKYSALADALLAYGKAANQYFTDGGTVDEVKDFNADLSKYKMVLNGDLPEGVEYIGTSLLLNSQNLFS